MMQSIWWVGAAKETSLVLIFQFSCNEELEQADTEYIYGQTVEDYLSNLSNIPYLKNKAALWSWHPGPSPEKNTR